MTSDRHFLSRLIRENDCTVVYLNHAFFSRHADRRTASDVAVAPYRHDALEMGGAVAYWLERRVRDRNKDFEREFVSPLTHTLTKVRGVQ